MRISCDRCGVPSLWTDDPQWFMETVCRGAGRCEAILVAERLAGVVISKIENAPEVLGWGMHPRGERRRTTKERKELVNGK